MVFHNSWFGYQLSRRIVFIMKETWLDIAGYEGYYQVSNFGNVKSLEVTYSVCNTERTRKSRIMAQEKRPNGYMQIGLCKGTTQKKFRIHRLVAMAFIPNPHNLPIVHHLDNIKSNNSSVNLEWCTFSKNTKHAYDMGLIKHPTMRLTTEKVCEIRRLYEEEGRTQKYLASVFNVGISQISGIVRYKSWK